MLTSQQAIKQFGEPSASSPHLTLWDVPSELEIGVIPRRIYCHKLMVNPLKQAFSNLINRGFVGELKTWDGCFNIRKARGLKSWSLHSWGLAVDVNAFENGLNATPKLSAGFVKCFTDAGFDWGGVWQRKDGMHFQLRSIAA
jgi:hypothetical protein